VTDKEANIYAAENRMRDGIRFFQKWTILSWGDVEDFTMAAIRDTERESLFELYETYQAQGIPLPSAIPTLKRTLRVHFRSSFETDPLTAMAAIVVPTETRDPLSWKVFEGDPLTENLTEGEYIRISGPPGKGKTNLGCVLMERWIKKGCRAFSNIRLEVPNHVYVSRTSELLRAIVQARRDGISWLFLLDEPRIAGYTRMRRITTRSQNLDKIVSMTRKLGGNMGLIEQNPEEVPALIVLWAQNMFFCHEIGVISIDLRGPRLIWRQDVRNFPRTKLPFETRDIAAFATDVDVDAMFQTVAGTTDQLQAVLNYLDQPHTKRASTDPRPRNALGQIQKHKKLVVANS